MKNKNNIIVIVLIILIIGATIVGVYYLAKVYFHLLSAGPVGHDDLCHIGSFFVFMFIDSAFPASLRRHQD